MYDISIKERHYVCKAHQGGKPPWAHQLFISVPLDRRLFPKTKLF